MSKLTTILLTAAIAFPAGIFAGPMRGHPQLESARNDLNAAERHITRSQEANEWSPGDEGGHGQKAKEAIQLAKDELRQAAEFLNRHEGR
jgi:hypothetical protein